MDTGMPTTVTTTIKVMRMRKRRMRERNMTMVIMTKVITGLSCGLFGNKAEEEEDE